MEICQGGDLLAFIRKR